MLIAQKYKNNELIKSEFDQPSQLQNSILLRILLLHNFDRFIKNSSTKNLESIKLIIKQIKGEIK